MIVPNQCVIFILKLCVIDCQRNKILSEVLLSEMFVEIKSKPPQNLLHSDGSYWGSFCSKRCRSANT